MTHIKNQNRLPSLSEKWEWPRAHYIQISKPVIAVPVLGRVSCIESTQAIERECIVQCVSDVDALADVKQYWGSLGETYECDKDVRWSAE